MCLSSHFLSQAGIQGPPCPLEKECGAKRRLLITRSPLVVKGRKRHTPVLDERRNCAGQRRNGVFLGSDLS